VGLEIGQPTACPCPIGRTACEVRWKSALSQGREGDWPRERVNEQVRDGGKERKREENGQRESWGKGRGEANGYRALDGEEGGGREDEDKSRTAESS